jgi:hypothetical protein
VLQSTAVESKVNSMVYEGEWENDLMHGNGLIKYYGQPEERRSVGEDTEKGEGAGGKHGRVLRTFRGQFEKGFPVQGELKTETEYFASVQYDRFTLPLNFATWYWIPDENSNATGTRLVQLEATSEEFKAVLHECRKSMPTLHPSDVVSIERVQNNDLRSMYNLQLRNIEKKVTKPPRSWQWTNTMEGWGFHAPVCRDAHAPVVGMFVCRAVQREKRLTCVCMQGSSVLKNGTGGGVHGAPPWQSIAEEGFMATLTGSDNGRVYGAGIYFARDFALAHKYAAFAAYRSQAHAGAGGHKDTDEQPFLVFLSRIVKGVYTGA